MNLDGVEFEVTNNPAEETDIDIQLTPNGIERLKKNHVKIKMHLKGDQVWDSKKFGTYIRKQHGNI